MIAKAKAVEFTPSAEPFDILCRFQFRQRFANRTWQIAMSIFASYESAVQALRSFEDQTNTQFVMTKKRKSGIAESNILVIKAAANISSGMAILHWGCMFVDRV